MGSLKIKNPIIKGFNPDPSICRVDEDYYIAVSTFEWFPGVQIYHSKDLKNWKLISQPVNRIEQLNMIGNPDSGGVWAPQLSYSDGKFWLIYSDVKVVSGNNFKDVSNYLITSETIDGDWSDPIFLNSSGFDPSLFHDEDGKKYLLNMVWDFRPKKHAFHGIIMQEYDVEKKQLVGKSEIIFKGTPLGLTEAPHMYKIGDYYYLLTAEGGTKYEHASIFARSENLWGPFELHPQTPFLTAWHEPLNPVQKSGHGSLVETHTGEWFFTHLMGRPIHIEGETMLGDRGYCPLGRETGIQRVEWKDDWPYIVDGPVPSLEIEGPKIEEHPFDKTYLVKDDFDDSKLNIHFQTLRQPYQWFANLDENPGHLRIYGGESMNSFFKQSLIARRWESLDFTAETKVSFEPETFIQLAGLTNYYNINNWSSLHVTWDEEYGKVIQLLVSDKGNMSYALDKPIKIENNVDYVYLRSVVSGHDYQYYYSIDGENWAKVGNILESRKLSDDYIYQEEDGFFTGAFVGMHVMDLTGKKLYADFDYFVYDDKDNT
ncbi:MAG: glycoside hydrolase family 43 protein [Bacteroidales bacterium]|nr:glycoside hydrolase family 43 protein [Bacteroidales bacterium]